MIRYIMRGLFPEQLALLIFQNSILAGLLVRVVGTGLFRTYPYFFGYVLVASVQALILSFLSPNSSSYIYPWLITQALLTFFGALVVLELYTLVLRDLTGIASASRRYVKVCVVLALLVSLLLLEAEQTPHGIVAAFMLVDRALVTSLLIFVLLLTAFLVYYPVPINRNLVVYSTGYALYFIAKGCGLLVLNISHAWSRQFSYVVVTASTLAMLFWLVGLSPAGEKKTMLIGYRWKRDDREQLLARLKALNASLLRAGAS